MHRTRKFHGKELNYKLLTAKSSVKRFVQLEMPIGLRSAGTGNERLGILRTGNYQLFTKATARLAPRCRRLTAWWHFICAIRLFSILSFVFSVHLAIAGESAFNLQCHKLLPAADEFARECVQRARPFSRTFYPSGGNTGEVETYSVHFQKLEAPSNFLLGCVLDFKRKINFAGLFYSPKPLDMSVFGEYRIVFIDPNDNVGLEIGGTQNTLIAVRQFVTDVVPPRFKGRPKNCEEGYIETIDGANATTFERFRKIDESQIEYCSGDYCKVKLYSTFLGTHKVPGIYAEHDLFLIDGNGVLMIKTDYYEKVCATKKHDSAGAYNIIFEMCPTSN